MALVVPSDSHRRRQLWLAAAVLALAFFNLTYRIEREALQEWDESLYATSAWEAVTHGHWLGTTFNGTLDYYNSKPPLNVWLIGLAFKAFGPSLVSLRLPSILSAFLTIAVLQAWTWRLFGARVALLASLILSTTFGFFHIHSARTANTDPLFTLLILLTAVTLVAERTRPLARAWLGPILAATFLLRGMAVLMPLAIVVLSDLISQRRGPRRLLPSAIAGCLLLLPTAAWAIARYRLDGWAFFERMINYDFVQQSVSQLEGHTGGPWFYVSILHRNQFDWLLAGLTAMLIAPMGRQRITQVWTFVRRHRTAAVLVSWAVVAVAVPTVMQTKAPWYLTPFYPVLAVGLAMLITKALARAAVPAISRTRLVAMTACLVLTAATAEARLLWYSFRFRDIQLSGQSLILAERDRLQGRRFHQDLYRRNAVFVARAMIGADATIEPVDLSSVRLSVRPGDYLLTEASVDDDDFELVQSNAVRWLYRRKDERR